MSAQANDPFSERRPPSPPSTIAPSPAEPRARRRRPAWQFGAFLTGLVGASVVLFFQDGGLAKERSTTRVPVLSKREDLPTLFRKTTPLTVDDLKGMERHFETLVKRVSPAVVAVRVGNSAGSGVVISPDGLVLCAAHVCEQPGKSASFTFPDGRTAYGKTMGTDHDMDAGLLQITDPGSWPHAQLGRPESIHIGDWVLALGHPGGFDPDRPVVARLGRILNNKGFLQTDCTLIGGDSGGPLFDMRGQVIGIHSRISESTTDNFHVPVACFVDDWDRLLKSEAWGSEGPAQQASIGLRSVDSPEGCRIESFDENSPAEKAGLLVGDIVLRIQDQAIPDRDALGRFVHRSKPGDELTVTVNRSGKELSLKVKAEPRRWRGGRWGPRP